MLRPPHPTHIVVLVRLWSNALLPYAKFVYPRFPSRISHYEEFGGIDIVRRLLQIPGIDVNAELNDSTNPILNAVNGGNLELVELLANAGGNLSYKGGRLKSNLLMFAIDSGSIPIVQYLIQKGVNINEADESGWFPLTLAVVYSLNDIAKILVDAGADLNIKFYGEPLIIFAIYPYYYNTEMFKYFIDNGVDVDAQDSDGKTALYWAISYENFEAFDFLVSAGADVNKQSSDGVSLLFLSIRDGNENMTTYLIDNGADVNLRTIRDFTPAYAAVVVNCDKTRPKIY